MNIQVISDIHAEFHQDTGYSFIDSLTPHDTNVLVIAGDFALIDQYEELIPLLVNKYPHIVMVVGNHEFYSCDRDTVLTELERLSSKYKNLHILENSHVTIDGQRFIGSTLWFPDLEKARPHWNMLNDFNVIRGFKEWVFEVNAKSVDFLHKNIQSTDVVVTHHIPTYQASNKKWWGSPMQSFFVCNMERALIIQHPKLWVFGHTHDSYDSTFDFPGKVWERTRLICNPFGYAGHAENPEYQENLVISI